MENGLVVCWELYILENKQTNKPTPAGQGRLTFGVSLGSAAAAGATVNEDDQDDEAMVLENIMTVSLVLKIVTWTWT